MRNAALTHDMITLHRLAPDPRMGGAAMGCISPRRIVVGKHNVVVASALAAALAVPPLAVAQGGPAPKPKYDYEKCYGIARAGKNDCQTANSSCAGTSKRDGQADSWMYVPAGSCEKVVGGNLRPKSD